MRDTAPPEGGGDLTAEWIAGWLWRLVADWSRRKGLAAEPTGTTFVVRPLRGHREFLVTVTEITKGGEHDGKKRLREDAKVLLLAAADDGRRPGREAGPGTAGETAGAAGGPAADAPEMAVLTDGRMTVTTARVLALLASADHELHGYEITRQTGLKSGTLYPMLARLAVDGYVASRWEEGRPRDRPPRHYYRITEAGVVRFREIRDRFLA